MECFGAGSLWCAPFDVGWWVMVGGQVGNGRIREKPSPPPERQFRTGRVTASGLDNFLDLTKTSQYGLSRKTYGHHLQIIIIIIIMFL